MSKDKGSKNNKKAPADKSPGKLKHTSSYKTESQIGTKSVGTDAFVPKPDPKTIKKH